MITTPLGPEFVKNDDQSGAKSGDHTQLAHSPDRNSSHRRSPAVFWLVETRRQALVAADGSERADGSRARRTVVMSQSTTVAKDDFQILLPVGLQHH